MTGRHRDALVVLLALATGATDATAFERLGNAFASVITGNLVLLGIGGARPDGRLALFSGCALAAYAIGVLATAPRRDENQPSSWPVSANLALGADLLLLVAVTVGWELSDGHPGRTAQALLLAAAAAAMGAQSTAVRRLGPISTTYLTSTFIGVLESIAARRWSADETRSVAILLVAFGGAAAATGLIVDAPRLLPILLLAPLVVVIWSARRLTAHDRP